MWGRALGNHRGGATCFTALWFYVGEGLGEGTVPLPGFWRFAQHSSCATGTLPALVLVLNPRGGGSEEVITPKLALEAESPENLVISSVVPNPTGFYSQKLRGFIFLALEPWAVWSDLGLCGLTWGWDPLLPRYPSWFLSTTWKCGTAHSAASASPHCISSPLYSNSSSPPLLPTWMNVASLNHWLSYFHTVQFSGNSGY